MIRRLLDWLAGKLGYVTREYPRINNGTDAVARGQRWEAFYTEEGGLADMLRAMRQECFEDWTAAPYKSEARDRFALKDEAIRDIGRRVQGVIETGKLRAHEQRFAQQR